VLRWKRGITRETLQQLYSAAVSSRYFRASASFTVLATGRRRDASQRESCWNPTLHTQQSPLQPLKGYPLLRSTAFGPRWCSPISHRQVTSHQHGVSLRCPIITATLLQKPRNSQRIRCLQGSKHRDRKPVTLIRLWFDAAFHHDRPPQCEAS
jgi:hypothetical protein